MKKKFSMTVEQKGDELVITKQSAGFTITELAGIFYWQLEDLHKQFTGEIKPDAVKKIVAKRIKKK